MANHPSRSGAISAELFVAVIDELQTVRGDEVDTPSPEHLRKCIFDAALRIAMPRAARKFRWIPTFEWDVEIDESGRVHNCNGEKFGLNDQQRRWVETEVEKISRKALAALEQTK